MSKEITTIGKFRVKLTEHAQTRCIQRSISTYHIINSLKAFGMKKLNEYNNTKKDIMLQDEYNQYTIIFSISNKCIYIITVIDKDDVFVTKDNKTIVQKLKV